MGRPLRLGAPNDEHSASTSRAHLVWGFAFVALAATMVAVLLGARGGDARPAGSWFPGIPQPSVVVGDWGPRGVLGGNGGQAQGGGLMTGPSLWCFALMQPFGYEPALLGEQLTRSVGIFACDEYAVFSNGSVPVGNTQLRTLPIGGSLTVQLGGKWNTAMNTDIFVRVWTAVFLFGRYKQHDWTVKVDPDAVFMPARLREVVSREPGGAIYLNNCRFGLHGPIEVLSRDAVAAYAAAPGKCEGVQRDAMDNTHPHDDQFHAFGEDLFIQLCMYNLGAGRVDEVDLLLSETACHQEVSCSDAKVSFHPFKSNADYFSCWGTANANGAKWEAAIAAAPAPSLAPPGEVFESA